MKKLLVLSVAALAATRLFGADATWTGAASPVNLWSDALNWTAGVPAAGDNLFFSGASGTANSNDTAPNTLYGNITFDSGAGPFVITGNVIDVGSNITNNEATNPQNLGLALNVVSSLTAHVVSGGNLALTGNLIGNPSLTITKTGNGVLALTANAAATGASTFNGTWQIDGGSILATGNSVLGVGNTSATSPNLVFNGGHLNLGTTGNNTNGNINLMQNATITYSGTGNANLMAANVNLTTTNPANVLTLNLASATAQFTMTNGNNNVMANYNGVLVVTGAGSLRFGTGGGGLSSGNVSMTLDMGTATTRIYGRNNNMSLTVGTFNGTAANFSSNNTTTNFTYNIGGNLSGQSSTDSTFGGIATNRSHVHKWGSGTLTVSGVASTTTGSFVVHGGTMAVAKLSDSGVASSIGQGADPTNLTFNGGRLRYTGTGDSTNRLFAVTANGGTIESAGSGAVNFTNAAALTFNGAANTTLTLTGASNGSLAGIIPNPTSGVTNLTKTGAGIWTLSGASTFTGVALVSQGVLNVTGSLAAGVSVQEGATIAGSGTFAGISTVGSNQGGKVDPDGLLSASSLTWGGSSNGSGTILIELGPLGLSDSIALSGALTKGAGTSFVFDFGNTGFLNNVYTLISYASTDFTTLDVSFINLPIGVPGVLTVGANSITLSTVPEPSTWALILGGFGLGLAVLRRRRAVR